jgi:hypothetical protein
MDAVLKPIMALLPNKGVKQKPAPAGRQPSQAPPAMHHLLYALRDLNPKYVAVAADVRVVPWVLGSDERPDVDAYVDEAAIAPRRPGHLQDGAAEGAENAQKPRKAKRSYGCCLTEKGTLTFVDPDGLSAPGAIVSRRDMERIEVRGRRHCVDAEVNGARVSIVWTMLDNKLQRADRATSRFREVAAEVLPDVEYLDVTEQPEEEEEKTVDDAAEDEDAGGEPADGDREVEQPAEDAAGDEADKASETWTDATEYTEAEQEPDEEAFDMQPVVEALERARAASIDVARRRLAAARWLADNPGPSEAADRNGVSAAAAAAGSTERGLTARERALRLALLVSMICERHRAVREGL